MVVHATPSPVLPRILFASLLVAAACGPAAHGQQPAEPQEETPESPALYVDENTSADGSVASPVGPAAPLADPPAEAVGAPAATVSVLPELPPLSPAELTEAHAAAAPGDIERGASKAGVCTACHGLDGNSADPQNPKLAGQHERYIARQLALFKTGERMSPVMMPFAAPLSPQDMRDIGAFYASQSPLPGVADESPVTDGPYAGTPFHKLGERLWRGGDIDRGVPACMACHGPTGSGNPGPAYPRIASQHAGYSATQLRAFREGLVWGNGDYANAIMAEVAKDLTDSEIEGLATYAEGLHRATVKSAVLPAPSPAPAPASAGSALTSAAPMPLMAPEAAAAAMKSASNDDAAVAPAPTAATPAADEDEPPEDNPTVTEPVQ